MPLIKSATRKAIGQNIETEQNAGKPHRQAIAIALDVARRNKRRKGGRLRLADGGEALSDADQAAMMPETYANPAVDHLIRNAAAIPKRAIEAAANYQPGQPETYDPAPIVDAAMLPMGTGAIAGVPMRAGEAVLGAGSVRHIYHSTAPENAVSIAQKGLMPRGEGTYFAPNERMAQAWHTEGNALYRVDPEKVKGLQSETGGLSPAETDSLLTHSKIPPSALEVSMDDGKTWKTIQKKSHGGTVRNPAVTRALAVARRAKGGKVHIGPIKSPHGGRTDTEEMKVPDGSYVLSADVVSHLGENNSDAGLKRAHQFFGPSGHFAKAQPRSSGGKSGGDGKPVECITAGGEYVIPPEVVRTIGGGDLDHGHKVLDRWSMNVRKDHIATLASLPPPAKD